MSDTDCSICKASIDTAMDNYVCFGNQDFKRWGPLGNVCAHCIQDVFEVYDALQGDPFVEAAVEHKPRIRGLNRSDVE